MLPKVASAFALLIGCSLLAVPVVAQPSIHQINELEIDALASVASDLEVGERLLVEQARLIDGEEPVALDLVRFEVFTEDAEIHIHGEDGETIESPPNNAYFKGEVVGDDESLITLSVQENGEIFGLASYDGKISILEGSSADGILHGYRVDPNSLRGTSFECGNEQLDQGLGDLGLDEAPLTDAPTAGGTPGVLAVNNTARVAIETDFEFYTIWNNTTNLVNYVGNLFAYMSGLYEGQINVNLVVSYLSIYTTSADPWVETSALCGLYEFGRYWNQNRTGVSRTIAHFLSGKGSGAGFAWIGVLCRAPFNTTASGCIGVSGTGSYGGDYGFTGGLRGNFNPSNRPSCGTSMVPATRSVTTSTRRTPTVITTS
ncbi:MAG: hypothetical protein HC897_05760, partial [Thermoanaerobaculia bacterium]|nr:hypothetical protein [Thermoanaerobaculia bacterium]